MKVITSQLNRFIFFNCLDNILKVQITTAKQQRNAQLFLALNNYSEQEKMMEILGIQIICTEINRYNFP